MIRLVRECAGLLVPLLLLVSVPAPLDAQFDDEAIYRTVLQGLIGGRPLAGEVLVQDSSATPPFADRIDEDDEDRRLIERLVAASSEQVASKTLALLPPVRYVSASEAVELTRRAGERVDVFAVSPIVYSDDGSKAAVFAEVFCGFLCASGGGFILTRRTGHWLIHRQFWWWVS